MEEKGAMARKVEEDADGEDNPKPDESIICWSYSAIIID